MDEPVRHQSSSSETGAEIAAHASAIEVALSRPVRRPNLGRRPRYKNVQAGDKTYRDKIQRRIGRRHHAKFVGWGWGLEAITLEGKLRAFRVERAEVLAELAENSHARRRIAEQFRLEKREDRRRERAAQLRIPLEAYKAHLAENQPKLEPKRRRRRQRDRRRELTRLIAVVHTQVLTDDPDQG